MSTKRVLRGKGIEVIMHGVRGWGEQGGQGGEGIEG